jgi:hypothetical protein
VLEAEVKKRCHQQQRRGLAAGGPTEPSAKEMQFFHSMGLAGALCFCGTVAVLRYRAVGTVGSSRRATTNPQALVLRQVVSTAVVLAGAPMQMPEEVGKVPGTDEVLSLQDAAQILAERRQRKSLRQPVAEGSTERKTRQHS